LLTSLELPQRFTRKELCAVNAVDVNTLTHTHTHRQTHRTTATQAYLMAASTQHLDQGPTDEKQQTAERSAMVLHSVQRAAHSAHVYSRRVWTPDEDEAIRQLVTKFGTKSWSAIAEHVVKDYGINGRTGKQCRERWHNHLGT
jgi:hypothetical protein